MNKCTFLIDNWGFLSSRLAAMRDRVSHAKDPEKKTVAFSVFLTVDLQL